MYKNIPSARATGRTLLSCRCLCATSSLQGAPPANASAAEQCTGLACNKMIHLACRPVIAHDAHPPFFSRAVNPSNICMLSIVRYIMYHPCYPAVHVCSHPATKTRRVKKRQQPASPLSPSPPARCLCCGMVLLEKKKTVRNSSSTLGNPRAADLWLFLLARVCFFVDHRGPLSPGAEVRCSVEQARTFANGVFAAGQRWVYSSRKRRSRGR